MIRVNKKILPDLAKFIEMRYGVSVLDAKEETPQIMDTLLRMQYWIDDVVLSQYFSGGEGYWSNSETFETRRTGKKLIEELKELENVEILHVGCGNNDLKELVGENVFGIDPYNPNADAKTNIEGMQKKIGEWDIVLCLGSINFGDENTIRAQIRKVVQMVKPGGKIYWRCNPGVTHANEYARWVDFFPWTQELLDEMADTLHCDILEKGWDHAEDMELPNGNRIFNLWEKRKELRTVQ
mgnify:FL=1